MGTRKIWFPSPLPTLYPEVGQELLKKNLVRSAILLERRQRGSEPLRCLTQFQLALVPQEAVIGTSTFRYYVLSVGIKLP